MAAILWAEAQRSRTRAESPQNPLKAAAEARQGRSKTKENSSQPTVSGALNLQETSSDLSRIRAAAKKNGEQRFTSLMHHITPDFLMEAYEALKRNRTDPP